LRVARPMPDRILQSFSPSQHCFEYGLLLPFCFLTPLLIELSSYRIFLPQSLQKTAFFVVNKNAQESSWESSGSSRRSTDTSYTKNNYSKIRNMIE
jgi:hypothetical protein